MLFNNNFIANNFIIKCMTKRLSAKTVLLEIDQN